MISDFLAETKPIACSGLRPLPGPCQQPFQVKLYDSKSSRERDAQLSLFLSRRTGQNYPPPDKFPGFHAHLRANRNPGFDITGKSLCVTSTDSYGNQEPPAIPECQGLQVADSIGTRSLLKEYTLPSSGNFVVNAMCQGPSEGCKVAKVSNTNDVVYLRGPFASFTTNQFSATDSSRPCSRKSCHLSNGTQTVTIYDGNMLVFLDRVVRL